MRVQCHCSVQSRAVGRLIQVRKELLIVNFHKNQVCSSSTHQRKLANSCLNFPDHRLYFYLPIGRHHGASSFTMFPVPLGACEVCHKRQSQLPNVLKRCAKCKTKLYCGRECQKADWKNHKKVCGKDRFGPASCDAATYSRSRNPNSICYNAAPFTALNSGTWLHNRPKEDVYRLLVDTYRMRIEDKYVFEGDVDEDSVYGGADLETALGHFKSYVSNAMKLDAEREQKLFPDWWTEESVTECLEFGRNDPFSNIGIAIRKSDIQEFYSQLDFPMQLRIFSEKLDGCLAAGMSGETMLQMQIAIEKNTAPDALQVSF